MSRGTVQEQIEESRGLAEVLINNVSGSLSNENYLACVMFAEKLLEVSRTLRTLGVVSPKKNGNRTIINL